MAFTGLNDSAKEDALVSLATLVLHDGGKPITADNINAVISATGNSVASYWGGMFESLLSGKDVDELIVTPSAAPAGAAAAAGEGGAAAAEAEKEESSSSASAGGAADLFGGSDSDSDSSS